MAKDNLPTAAEASSLTTERAPYRKPTLTNFGPVAQMTGSNNGSIQDPNNPLLSGMVMGMGGGVGMGMDMDMDMDMGM